ncbi:hypothetical protein [Escherichia coli]|uniref:hypothetical protein n=1 Tax=Escherichia coli TaxID=562 RepID=UPI001BD2FE29|nr:hypothetical protein [Escherichia coli]MBS9628483.1 hypothetical protein [Escherichia coli]
MPLALAIRIFSCLVWFYFLFIQRQECYKTLKTALREYRFWNFIKLVDGTFFYPGSAGPVNEAVNPVLRVFDFSAVARGKDWPGYGWLAETATRQRAVILCVSTAF